MDSPWLAMYKLHWLPIMFRLDYKKALLMFRCYKGEAPKYLCELLDIEVRTRISRSLRSYQEEVISYWIPFAKHKTFAYRSFSVAGPKIWYSLPVHLHLSETVDSFKTKLKIYFFHKCYSDLLQVLLLMCFISLVCTVPQISLAWLGAILSSINVNVNKENLLEHVSSVDLTIKFSAEDTWPDGFMPFVDMLITRKTRQNPIHQVVQETNAHRSGPRVGQPPWHLSLIQHHQHPHT